MVIFSAIAAVLSMIVYLLPFIIKYVRKEEIYRLPNKKETISNQSVFIVKSVGLSIVIIIFDSVLYPTKVKFYPLKIVIFIIVLIILQWITGLIFCAGWLNKISGKEMFKQYGIYCCVLFLILIVLHGFSYSDNEMINYQEAEEYIVYDVESINSSGLVFYYDENGLRQVLSITDENVSIDDSDKVDTHLEKKITYKQYRNKYDKDTKLIKGDKIQEEYIVFIPINQLNDLMK